MTTYVEARDAIVGLVHPAWVSAYPAVPVFYENTLRVDMDKVGDSFLRVEVDFDDARQMTVNDAPEHATYGTLYLTLFAKDGTGVRDTLGCFDYLTDLAKFKTITGVRFGAPTPGRRTYKDGWRSYELRVPFWFYSAGLA